MEVPARPPAHAMARVRRVTALLASPAASAPGPRLARTCGDARGRPHAAPRTPSSTTPVRVSDLSVSTIMSMAQPPTHVIPHVIVQEFSFDMLIHETSKDATFIIWSRSLYILSARGGKPNRRHTSTHTSTHQYTHTPVHTHQYTHTPAHTHQYTHTGIPLMSARKDETAVWY